MICTFYHGGLNACQNAYCYYVKNETITCPIKKQMIEKILTPDRSQERTEKQKWIR